MLLFVSLAIATAWGALLVFVFTPEDCGHPAIAAAFVITGSLALILPLNRFVQTTLDPNPKQMTTLTADEQQTLTSALAILRRKNVEPSNYAAEMARSDLFSPVRSLYLEDVSGIDKVLCLRYGTPNQPGCPIHRSELRPLAKRLTAIADFWGVPDGN